MAFESPRTVRELASRFGDDASCRAALADLRWRDGFACPRCGGTASGHELTRDLTVCRACGHEVSPTGGTLLHRSHVPLPDWFTAAWAVSTTRGLNALTLSRQVGVTKRIAWSMLARSREAMARSLSAPLTGVVEADEAFLGRKEHQSTVEVLVEARKDGRVRMGVVTGQTMAVLTPFIAARVEPGSTIRTDSWKGYNGLDHAGFVHERIVHTPGWAERGERSTPYADEAISAVKRWILATYNKPPTPENLDLYLAEFCFRREFRDPGQAFEALLRGLVTPR